MKRLTALVALAAMAFTVFAFFSPATGQDRTEERLSALETRVAVLEGEAGSPARSSTSATSHTITGTITIIGQIVGSSDRTSGVIEPIDDTFCTGGGGFDDIRNGASVVVRDQTGVTIATGNIGPGKPDPAFPSVTCVFPFTVLDVPQVAFYEIEVSHRGGVSFSHAELETDNWEVDLELTS